VRRCIIELFDIRFSTLEGPEWQALEELKLEELAFCHCVVYTALAIILMP